MAVRKINENHAFYDVTPGDSRGYDWDLWRFEEYPDSEDRFRAVERIGRKLDGETFVEAAVRMGVEPTYRLAKLADDEAREAAMVEVERQQVRYVTQSELDFVGGLGIYRRDIEPNRQIVVVASAKERRVDYMTPGAREALQQL
jgi:hypothetical protein